MNGRDYTKFWGKVKEKIAGAAGGRNEETYNKYAEGVRKINIRAEGSNSRYRKEYLTAETK
jgi:hypothetical protein